METGNIGMLMYTISGYIMMFFGITFAGTIVMRMVKELIDFFVKTCHIGKMFKIYYRNKAKIDSIIIADKLKDSLKRDGRRI